MSLHLVLGGARSGKSRFAEKLALDSGLSVCVVVTAQALDAEMKLRIERHRRDRPPGWTTVEAPIALADAVRRQSDKRTCVIVDCLTLWLANLLDPEDSLCDPIDADDIMQLRDERTALLSTLADIPGPVVLVANEVGLGLVPETALGRAFRDEAGRLNQILAQLCDQVTLVVAGLPLRIK